MSIKPVNEIVAPLAEDILLGEFRCYFNKGLPSETLIGATRDGAKLNIDAVIKELTFDGSYGYTLDANGNPLVRYEKLNVDLTLNNLSLKAINLLSLDSDNWENNDWSATGGEYTKETTIVGANDYSIKMTGDAINEGVHAVYDSSKNLSQFGNGESSATSDEIGFGIYADSTNLAYLSGNIDVRLHNDVEGTETNYFEYSVDVSTLVADRWNYITVAKSALTSVGSPDLTAITGISFQFDTAPSSEASIYIDSMIDMFKLSKSTVTGVNGTSFTYTDNSTYMTYSHDNVVNDYIYNVCLIGQLLNGKMVRIQLSKVLCDNALEMALEDKDEKVNETVFSAHYKGNDLTNVPLMIRFYD